MPNQKITFSDKIGVKPKTVRVNQVWDDDMNQIKSVVNENDDKAIYNGPNTLSELTTIQVTPTVSLNISDGKVTGIVVGDELLQLDGIIKIIPDGVTPEVGKLIGWTNADGSIGKFDAGGTVESLNDLLDAVRENGNLYLGNQAGANSNGTDNVLIGDNVDTDGLNDSNVFKLKNLIKGDFVSLVTEFLGNFISNGIPFSANATSSMSFGKSINTNVGTGETCYGVSAGQGNSGNRHTSVGHLAGLVNTATALTAIGYEAGRQNTGGDSTSVGYRAGRLNSGAFSSFLGRSSGNENSGNQSNFIGYRTGEQNSGTNVTAIGVDSGRFGSGDNAVFLGGQTGISNSKNNVFAINNNCLPSYADRPTALLDLTSANGCSVGCTYMYANLSNNAIEFVIIT